MHWQSKQVIEFSYSVDLFCYNIFGLGPLTLNELTPEEAANLEAAQRHSSRESIPVIVEEPNIIPTPDDESEDGSEE